MMRPDDRALDVPCAKCGAAVGMPCTLTTTPRAGLLELQYAHKERRSAVALSDSFPSTLPAGRGAERRGESDNGAGRTCEDDALTGPPLHADVDRGGIRAAREEPATASPGQPPSDFGALPVVELECGNPASTREAIKALQNPNADIFCWFHGKYEKRRAS